MNNNIPYIAGANVLPQAPMAYGYAAPCVHDRGCDDFILIVVLFILLIIVGAVCFCG
nr:YjcZ family sporulation protein [Neobacillus sp. Marseille-Q6967]